MKTYQDLYETYKGIAKNLNLQGESVEMISQMLAEASYISEVENIAYSQEASLERATLINSKIQHCLNNMYSVFRGSCPRVIVRFRSTKYFRLNIFDELCTSNNYKIYYLGYLGTNSTATSYDSDQTGTAAVSGESGFIYAPTVIPPTGDTVEYTLIGLLSKETATKTWTLTESNTYYVDFLENDLSSDIYATVNGDYFDTSRVFSDHITKGCLYDQTLPSFGLRLYAPDIFRSSFSREATETPANTEISCTAFKYCELDSFNTSELKQTKIKGATLVPFDSDFLVSGGYTELATGLIFLDEVPRDSVTTIHYKANRDRYVNSILRSNSDIGTVLEEMYPEKVRKSGTHYVFESPSTTRIKKTETTMSFDFPNPPETYTLPAELGGTGLYLYSSSMLSSSMSAVDFTYGAAVYPKALRFPGASGFRLGTPQGRVLRIPTSGQAGILRVLAKTPQSIPDAPSTYDILPSISVLLKSDSELKTAGITVNLMRMGGDLGSAVLTNSESIESAGITLSWSLDNSVKKTTLSGTNYIDLSDKNIVSHITIYAVDKAGNNLDTEIIPVIEEYTSDSGSESKYTLNLLNDTVWLESDWSGQVKESSFPVSTSAVLYQGHTQNPDGVFYEILQSPGLGCTIDSGTGQIEITSADPEISVFQVPIRGTLGNISVIGILEVRKSHTLIPKASQASELYIGPNSSGLGGQKFLVPPQGTEITYEFSNPGSVEYLYLWSESATGLDILDLTWTTTTETVENLVPAEYDTVPSLSIYYIPYSLSGLLSNSEIQEFIDTRAAYYVTSDITVKRGNIVKAAFLIKAEVYQNLSIDDKVEEILGNYEYTFALDLESKKSEIIALLSKITNVKQITDLSITYTSELGDVLEWSEVKGMLETSYFSISWLVNTVM